MLGGHVSVVILEVDPIHMLYSMTVEGSGGRLLQAPRDRKIEARFYFPELHDQLIFAGRAIRLPVAERIAKRNLSIPFRAKLGIDEFQWVAAAIEKKQAQA